MNPMKRLGLAALLVIGVTLLASTPARAETYARIELTNTGDEPEATGQASVDVRYEGVNGAGDPVYSIRASLKCHNLTHSATYWTPVGSFTANRKGNGSVSGTVVITVRYWWGDPVVDWMLGLGVARLDPDGTLTTVLSAYSY